MEVMQDAADATGVSGWASCFLRDTRNWEMRVLRALWVRIPSTTSLHQMIYHRLLNKKKTLSLITWSYLIVYILPTMPSPWLVSFTSSCVALCLFSKIDSQPRRDASLSSYLFFVVFIIVGSFFVLNLFVGVIIENFNTLKKKVSRIDVMLCKNGGG